MAAVTHGHVDVEERGFVARFEQEPAIVERIQTIQRRRWLRDDNVWVVDAHWPSVRRLLHIASDLGWHITPKARAKEQQLKDESDALEYSLDVIHNGFGEAVFQCKVADDDALLAKVRGLPGAYFEGEWCVPTDWERCCGQLRELVEANARLEISPAAWRLLTEPDVAHLYVRSSAPPPAAVRIATPPPQNRAPSLPWKPAEQDLHMQALSHAITADGFQVSDALGGKLLPYQVAGVHYTLSAQRALLADEDGLGKTVQALAALETAARYPALVVCPGDLLRSWRAHAEHWLPASRTIRLWEPGEPGAAQSQADVLIVSYASLQQHRHEIAAQRFESIVADESHYLRNHASKRTRAALAIAAQVPGLRLCLSGAPLPGQPIELVAQLAFLGVLKRHFGGFWPFADRYCAPRQTELGTVLGAENLDELAQRVRAHCYCRRERAAVLSQLASEAAQVGAEPSDKRRKPRVTAREAAPKRSTTASFTAEAATPERSR